MYYLVSIITAWQCISPEMIVKGFRTCCISSAMDDTDDNILWNDSEEDGNVRSECKEGDTDPECGDSYTDLQR